MLGGGNFITQNKVLPGTYINFVSVPRPSNVFGERGFATIGMSLGWGDDIITVSKEELQKDSLKLLGYSFDDVKLRPIREVLLSAKTVYVGRLDNKGEKAKATANGLTFTAKYPGVRGNDLVVVIKADIDNKEGVICDTFFGKVKVDSQRLKKGEAVKSNDYFDVTGTANYEGANGESVQFKGGTDSEVSVKSHQDYLANIESYYFNVIGYAGKDDSISSLYVSFVKRLRDEVGKKCQAVLFNKAANYEGVINVTSRAVEDEAGFVYFVTGAIAGANVNKGLDNSLYLGEFTLKDRYVQRDLEKAILKGEFVLHKSDDKVRVLEDINSFVDFSVDKNEDFKQNQVIRVLDQIAMDISKIFGERYVGKVQNNADGRVSLWADITSHANKLLKLGAIEDFKPDDVVVMPGEDKDSVDVEYLVKPVMVMRKLYMVVRVK